MLSVNFTASTELNLFRDSIIRNDVLFIFLASTAQTFFSDSIIRNYVLLILQHQLNKPFLVTVLGIIRNNVQLSLQHQLN